MRRIALLAFVLLPSSTLLSGCNYVGSPFDNFGDFVGDTHTIRFNPNRPVGHSENVLRSMGRALDAEPLVPEAGNIWPGPQAPDPTLEDIERQQNQPLGQSLVQPNLVGPPPIPDHSSRPAVRGSSSPPPNVPSALMPRLAPVPGPSGLPPAQAAPQSRTLPTPQGGVFTTPGGNGVTTYTSPNGGTGILVPNGNGTSTMIGTDGSVQTVPSAR